MLNRFAQLAVWFSFLSNATLIVTHGALVDQHGMCVYVLVDFFFVNAAAAWLLITRIRVRRLKMEGSRFADIS